MKNSLFIISILSLCVIKAFSQWQPVAPTFGINGLADIHFINHRGVVVGEWGYISNTADSGKTWQLSKQTGTYQNFNCVDFTQGLYYACGNSGFISLSHDSGLNWNSIKIGSNERFNFIHFVNSTHGWVCGNKGEIYSTQNGGVTWQKRTIGSQGTQDAVYVKFFSTTHGLIVFRNGALLKTTNGGLTWTNHSNNNSRNISAVHFLTMNKGCMISSEDLALAVIRYDSIGSMTFGIFNLNGLMHYAYRMEYANDSTIYVACKSGIILKSVNNGGNWSTFTYSSNQNLYGMHFFSSTSGIMVGHLGKAIQTNNGTTWTELNGTLGNNPIFNSGPWASDIKFTTPSKGVMLLAFKLYSTSNGGGNWSPLAHHLFINAEKIAKASSSKLFIISYDSSVYRSVDSGNTWQTLYNCPCKNKNSILNFEFVDNKGYVLCGNNELYSTNNFGDSWSAVNVISKIHNFEIDQTGAIIFGVRNDSAANKFFRSYNSGITWDSVLLPNNLSGKSISSYCLLDDSTVLITRAEGDLNVFNYVYKSTNRGLTWKELSTAGPILTSASPRSLHLKFKKIDHQNVWMYMPELHGLETLMEVYYSNDAGENWYRQIGYSSSRSGAMDVIAPSHTKFASIGRVILSSDNYGQLTSLNPPGALSNTFVVTQRTTSTIQLKWNKKNCDRYLILMSAIDTVNMKPMHGPEYVKYRGMGGNSYVGYFGVDTFATISPLSPNTTYHFALFEYNGSNYDAVYDVENITRLAVSTYNGVVIDSSSYARQYCSEDSIFINFTSDVPALDSVDYRLIMSNSSGTWGGARILGTISKTVAQSGRFSCKLPSVSQYSNKYVVRVDVISPTYGLIQSNISKPFSISTPVLARIYTEDSIKCTDNMTFTLSDSSKNAIASKRKWILPNQTTTTDSLLSYTATDTSTKIIRLIAANEGCIDSAEQQIHVYNKNDFTIVKSRNSICGNSSVILRDTKHNIYPFVYNWFKGNLLLSSTSGEINITTPGDYYVHRIDPDFSCSSYSDTIRISYYQKPLVQISSAKTFFCSNDSLLLTTLADTICKFSWIKNMAQNMKSDPVAKVTDSLYIRESGGFQVVAKNASDTSCQSLSTTVNVSMRISPQKPYIIQNNKLLTTSVFSNFYQWYKNDTIISGANGSSYMANQTAIYKIRITESNTCSETSDPYWYTEPNSVDLILPNQIPLNVFPNPFNDELSIQLKADAYVVITDVNGKIKNTFNLMRGSHTIHLADYPQGVYFLSARFNDLPQININLVKQK